ncbi:MAG: thioredoxin:protein disulfide reductase [Candidatus Dependentiae bacterium]|nr:thioredoxin:protein disulfide reductase [Candidatus Dependentiae bacterium]
MILESLLHETQSLPLVLFASFIAGILASFTPCIYPMLPITMGIITAQGAHSMLVNFFLSLSYGLGIATVYATLGYISVKTNLMFGQWLGNPYFIGAIIALFLYLAFSMFGFYEMYTPRFLQNRSNPKYKGGSFTYSFMFGVITGAAASPCLTPALALLLGFASKQNNPLIGFGVLFAFAMGLSMLLIVLGTFSSTISLLPRAGSWMEEVKKIFGFLLLIVCAYFLQPITSDTFVNTMYVLICLAAGIYYAYRSRKNSMLKIPLSLLSALLLIAGCLLTAEIYFQQSDTTLIEQIERMLL